MTFLLDVMLKQKWLTDYINSHGVSNVNTSASR